MTGRPIWQWSACDQANAIARKEISAVDAVSAAVARMRVRNPALNAVVDDLGDAALLEAEQHDRTLANDGPIGPLHGVPITIKVNVDQKGRATTNGVAAFSNVIAPADSPAVANLKKAGAVIIGRTNTPEFSFRVTTDNEIHGRTFNPWDENLSPGGSSGGAASAVISGIGAIAHGNDIGGSLRYPASATGAVTVKPGLGRTPAYNPSQTSERDLLAQLMSVQGVIAREVRDVRLAMRSLIQYHPHDPWMVPMPFEGPAQNGPLKVAFTLQTFEFNLHPNVEKALHAARDALKDAGYEVVVADPPAMRDIAHEGARCLFGEIKARMLDDVRKYGSDKINGIFDHYLEYFQPYEGLELMKALARRSHYIRQWQLFLEQYPLVLTPFLPQPFFDWDRDTQGIEGVREVLGSGIYILGMNFLGLPAGIVPAGLNDGLPIGVQVVGRRFREDMILDACEAIESRLGVFAERLFERQ